MLGIFLGFFVVCGFVFKINLFKRIFQEYHQSFQTVWIQIRTDVLSGLIWVQIVCKDYQQTTKVASSELKVVQIIRVKMVSVNVP